MNLWLRLLRVLLAALFRAPLDPLSGVSRVPFRVMPHDLDVSLHMNNGRYWTLMDLGRIDLVIRSGLGRAMWWEGWTPILSAGKIRFRRELRLGRALAVETRIVAAGEGDVVFEQRVVSRGRDGAPVLNAVALLRGGLYDRKAKAFVPTARLLALLGHEAAPLPNPSPEVAAFLAAEEALRRAA